MNPDIPRDPAQRATALGDAGGPAAIDELICLTSHPHANVRRCVASALGKLAAHDGIARAIPRLCELTRDPAPQVRQYAVKALGKIADESSLPALRDVANRPNEPEYNLRSAMLAIELIEKAQQARDFAPAACSRCGKPTTPEERRLSQTQFQRVYCDTCFNAVFIERRNFDAKVQNQKTILTENRTIVQSQGERRIADWLTAHAISFRYDDKLQIVQGYAIRPDFYLPLFDVYIEFWGLDTTDYVIGMNIKKKLYQQEGKKVVSVYPSDIPQLDRTLTEFLTKLGYHP
jgi:hypothetical protein